MNKPIFNLIEINNICSENGMEYSHVEYIFDPVHPTKWNGSLSIIINYTEKLSDKLSEIGLDISLFDIEDMEKKGIKI